MLSVLIVGTAWFTVGALGKAAPTQASRDVRTGEALRLAKNALLAHVAKYAALDTTTEPGQMPCPEALSLGSPGEASGTCPGLAVGRLQWAPPGISTLSVPMTRCGERPSRP